MRARERILHMCKGGGRERRGTGLEVQGRGYGREKERESDRDRGVQEIARLQECVSRQ